MKFSTQALALAGVLMVAGAGAGHAQSSDNTIASPSTSEASLRQLIAGTDLTTEEARGMTLDEIVAERWQNNSDNGRS